jgi:hypothetical protein
MEGRRSGYPGRVMLFEGKPSHLQISESLSRQSTNLVARFE